MISHLIWIKMKKSLVKWTQERYFTNYFIHNLMGMLFCSHSYNNKSIETNICMWHGSTAAVPHAKICSDWKVRYWITARCNFYQIWIAGEKVSVRWFPAVGQYTVLQTEWIISLPSMRTPGNRAWSFIIYHIEAETKWPPFCRRHFQMHFLEWKCLNIDYNFTEVCS